MMSASDLFRWLNTARRGAAAIYHTGFLFDDRAQSSAVRAIAELAWQAHLNGTAYLTQRRLEARRYQYIITQGAPA